MLLILPHYSNCTCFTQSSFSQPHVTHNGTLEYLYLFSKKQLFPLTRYSYCHIKTTEPVYTKQLFPAACYSYCQIKPDYLALHKAAVPNHMLHILPHKASCSCIAQNSCSQAHVIHPSKLSHLYLLYTKQLFPASRHA